MQTASEVQMWGAEYENVWIDADLRSLMLNETMLSDAERRPEQAGL